MNQKPQNAWDADFVFTVTPKSLTNVLQEGATIARDVGSVAMASSEVIESRRQREHVARQASRNDIVTALGLAAGAFGLFRRLRG